jgi:hypothetical protein
VIVLLPNVPRKNKPNTILYLIFFNLHHLSLRHHCWGGVGVASKSLSTLFDLAPISSNSSRPTPYLDFISPPSRSSSCSVPLSWPPDSCFLGPVIFF